MAKPKGKVKIEWSPDFAYAIGLITTDGNLSPDGRHVNFTSKDLELIKNFHRGLRIENHISKKARGCESDKKYFVTQFGDVLFYRFLESIGLMPNKSLRLCSVSVPDEYFFDFLRGHFDGDGTFYSYWDPRWKSSYMFYTVFISASQNHIKWLQKEIHRHLGIRGHISISSHMATTKMSIAYQLKYAKAESLLLLPHIYPTTDVLCLKRKHLKIIKALSILVKL
ncbi:MAG: hypothetical protein AAB429_03535 [Patescibacteria group bacterium]